MSREFMKTGFALVGLLLLLAGCATSPNRRLRYQIDSQYSVHDPQFLRSIGQLLGPALIAGNKTTTLLNGVQIFPAMLQAVRSAEKTIDFETYVYWSGNVGKQFADALAERARSGVHVHVIIDWVGASRIEGNFLEQMMAAGVQVERFNPPRWYNPFRINHRTHRKLLIIDGKIGFTGGAGIGDEWSGNADSPGHWRDTHFQLEGPAVAQMQAAFMDNWLKTRGEVLHDHDYFPELKPVGNDLAQVFQSSPREGSESVELMYLLSIAAAKKNIRISASYFVPDENSIRELVEARERGVSVEIILPGSKIDAQIVRHASRRRWGPLLQAGVKIYEYVPTMYHCKVMVVDDVWVSAGSANFDSRSFRLNDEANLNIYSPEFAAEQIRIFESDKGLARLIDFNEWKHRSIWKHCKEFCAGLLHSQL